MSYRTFNSGAVGKGIRSNHRSQYNWFRCTNVAEALEHWDTEIESGRHLDSFKAFESSARRRSQSAGMGLAAEEY